jgi:hypothetical protein
MARLQPSRIQGSKESHQVGAPYHRMGTMRKGVHYLFRYRDVSLGANSRYLVALSVVSDPTARVAEVDGITRRKRTASG